MLVVGAGLHAARPPFSNPLRGQDKLVHCIRGRILGVAVDVRCGSPTYGRWVSAELSSKNGHQLFIPIGFAHSFVTLKPDCEVSYKSSDIICARGGQRHSLDSAGIDWPIPASITPKLSGKKEIQLVLSDFDNLFAYDGRPLVSLDCRIIQAKLHH